MINTKQNICHSRKALALSVNERKCRIFIVQIRTKYVRICTICRASYVSNICIGIPIIDNIFISS